VSGRAIDIRKEPPITFDDCGADSEVAAAGAGSEVGAADSTAGGVGSTLGVGSAAGVAGAGAGVGAGTALAYQGAQKSIKVRDDMALSHL
jgi:hypothetical protein